jgi:ribonuclease HI
MGNLPKNHHGLVKRKEGYCALGNRMEVFDAELHAVYEALLELSVSNYPPTSVYICIDNSAAIFTLINNPDRNEAAYLASKIGQIITKFFNSINTVWLPSHCGIEGNEAADNLAKKGSDEEQNRCIHSYTSHCWLRRKAKSEFFKKWANAVDDIHITWKYPEEWSSWSFRYARSIFRVYCGRTEIDPKHGEEAAVCKCQSAEISSKHILGHCPLFDHARSRLSKPNELPPIFTNDLVLDKEWGAAVRKFLGETRWGFSKIFK